MASKLPLAAEKDGATWLFLRSTLRSYVMTSTRQQNLASGSFAFAILEAASIENSLASYGF